MTSETEVIYPESKIRTHSERLNPGGGGVNVARVLCDFGYPSELVYLSGGATGKILDDELAHSGVPTHCIRNSAPTRIAFTVHQNSNHQEYRFVPEGPIVSSDAYSQLIDYLASLPLDAEDIMVASGSLPRGVPDTAYAEIASVVNARRARLVLDTSGAGLSGALSSGNKLFLVKPSLNELQRLIGHKLDEDGARDFAQSLVQEGKADHIAVSMGSHGAFLANAQGVLRLPTYLVKVRSAVGAGDSFVAALVYYLARGNSMEDSFRYGVAAGAAAVMTDGHQLCRPEDVEELYTSAHV